MLTVRKHRFSFGYSGKACGICITIKALLVLQLFFDGLSGTRYLRLSNDTCGIVE